MTKGLIIIIFSFLLVNNILSQDIPIKIEPDNYFKINSNPDSAKVFINSKYMGLTPLILKNYLRGQYHIKLEIDNMQSEELFYNYGGKNDELFLVLDGEYGLLNIVTFPSNANVFINDSLIGKSPLYDVKYKTGKHIIKIVKEEYEEFIQQLFIRRMKKNVDRNLVYKYGFLNYETINANTEIRIDEEKIEYQSDELIKTKTGERDLEILVDDFHRTINETINVMPNSQNEIKLSYNYFSLKHPLQSALLPGLGQFKDDSKIKGIVYFLSFAASAALFINSNSNYKKKLDNHNDARQFYSEAQTELEAIFYRNELETKTNDLNNAIDDKNLHLGILVGVYLINLIDASIFHNMGANIEVFTKPISDSLIESRHHIGIKYNF